MYDKTLSIVWSLHENLETEPLVADIKELYAVSFEPQDRGARTWFDTFDWRLYKKKFYLYSDGKDWNLVQGNSADKPVTHPHHNEAVRMFFWDFPTSRLRTVIEPILEMRTLLPLVTVDFSVSCLRILNKDEKTVARIFLDEHIVRQTGDVYRSLKLEGVRGYDKQFNKLVRFFNQYGITRTAGVLFPFREAVQACGRKPLDYSSKFVISLKPAMIARQAMVLVYQELLRAMLRNEHGVVQDLDSEFLHDFRVAIRRTRSGLGLVKNVLPATILEQAKSDFAWLGKVTGPTRDLDVYLLYEQDYRTRLPQRLQKGLDVFFADLRSRREMEQEKLTVHLNSPQYREIVSNWLKCLESGCNTEPAANSARPVIELAREIIFRKYRKVIKEGRVITPLSPDEDLHRLRIQCKKLRYILEFFASLFPRKEMKLVISHLKQLQNNLGDFNDLSVQQDMLRHYLAALRPGSKKSQELTASLGGLLTNLYHEQHRVRENFASKFKGFSARENTVLYKKLFAEKVRIKARKDTAGDK